LRKTDPWWREKRRAGSCQSEPWPFGRNKWERTDP
jgi:hypothetical protein